MSRSFKIMVAYQHCGGGYYVVCHNVIGAPSLDIAFGVVKDAHAEYGDKILDMEVVSPKSLQPLYYSDYCGVGKPLSEDEVDEFVKLNAGD